MSDDLKLKMTAQDEASARFIGLTAVLKDLEKQIKQVAIATQALSPSAQAQALDPLIKKTADVKNELGELEKVLGKASEGFEKLSSNLRHATALFDEFFRDQRGQMIGTIGALARDSGVLTDAIGLLGTEFGVVGAVGIGAAAAFALVGYEALRSSLAIQDMVRANELFGDTIGITASLARQWQFDLRSDLNLSAGSALDLVTAFGQLPDVSTKSAKALADFTSIASTARGIKLEEAIKEVTKAAREGGPAIIKLAEEYGAHFTAAQKEAITSMHNSGQGMEALDTATDKLTEAVDANSGAVQRSISVWSQWFSLATTVGEAGIFAMGPTPPGPPGGMARTPEPLAGSEKEIAKQMGDFLRDTLHLSIEQISAVLSQAKGESQFKTEAGLGTAHQGMFQWDEERWKKFLEFAKSTGQAWNDWKAQLSFIVLEIRNMTKEFDRAGQSGEALSRLLTEKVLIPKDTPEHPHQMEDALARRAEYARSIYATLITEEDRLRQKEEKGMQEEVGKAGSDELRAQATYLQDLISRQDNHIQGLMRRLELTRELAAVEMHIATQSGKDIEATKARTEGQIKAAENALRLRGITEEQLRLQRESTALDAGLTGRRDLVAQRLEALAQAGQAGTPEFQTLREEQLRIDNEIAKAEYQIFASSMRNKLTEHRGNLAAIEQDLKTWQERAAAVYKNDTIAYKRELEEIDRAGKAARQRMFQSSMTDYSMMSRANEDVLKGFEARIQARVKGPTVESQADPTTGAIQKIRMAQVSQNDAYEYTKQIIGEIYTIQLEVLQAQMAIADKTGDQAQKLRIWREEMDIGLKTERELDQIELKRVQNQENLVKKWAQPLTQAFDSISSSLENAITSVLTKKKTWKQAEVEVASAVTEGLLKAMAGEASKALAKSFLDAMAGEGLGEMLGKKIISGIGSLFSKTVESVGTAGFSGIIGGGAQAATSAATEAAPIVGAIGTTSQEIVGAITAGDAGIVGAIQELVAVQTAAFAKPSFLGTTFQYGGIVPSAAGGMVSGGGLSILHPKEMVLPADLSEGVQHMIQRGGGNAPINLHFHGPADGPSIDRWFRDAVARNSGAFRDLVRSNSVRMMG